ncbi:acid phosphatase [Dorcoceras hygrometricum]|uniref:Acid phosphatase n=1 Tax=Dorcoceras hygrometricum TaxID=472368 RepID=A0A2Z7CNE3_9LAMI|nr:acid phosphatase [Dorcoceras hygrometricum]
MSAGSISVGFQQLGYLLEISRWYAISVQKPLFDTCNQQQSLRVELASLGVHTSAACVAESYCSSADAIWRLATAKRCRLHKLIRQHFALALKIQQEDFALIFQQSKLQWIQSQDEVPDASNSSIQSYEVVDPSEVEEGEM